MEVVSEQGVVSQKGEDCMACLDEPYQLPLGESQTATNKVTPLHEKEEKRDFSQDHLNWL